MFSSKSGLWLRGRLRRAGLGLAGGAVATGGGAPSAFAHNVSDQARQMMVDGDALDIVWLGAEHMLTGYDHILFLLGILFFLSNMKQIVQFITAFTFGHTLTLLGATLLGVKANAHLIDALIALTVCYKAAENLNVFQNVMGKKAPNLLYMVFVFGLIHGFGLSTRLQEMTLMADPQLVSKIFAFNIGVEFGQIAALALMVGVIHLWRQTSAWQPITRISNTGLFAAGLAMFGVQISALVGAGG